MAFRGDAGPVNSMVLDSFDPDALRLAVQRSDLNHVVTTGERFRGRLYSSSDRDVRMAWGHYNLPVLAEGPLASDRPTMCIMLAGKGDAVFNGQQIGSDRVLFFGEGAELCTVLPAAPSWISFQIDRNQLEAMGIEGLRSGFEHDPLPGSLGARIRSRILRALADIEDPGTALPLINGELASLEDTLLSTIAHSRRDKPRVYQHRPRKRRSSDRSVAQDVAEYMRCNLGDEHLRVMDVCLQLGHPIKNVERSFLKAYGMTPKRYLTLQRLSLLRRRLMSGEAAERNLTDLYLDCGLAHFGRTAAQYQALFGERPSET